MQTQPIETTVWARGDQCLEVASWEAMKSPQSIEAISALASEQWGQSREDCVHEKELVFISVPVGPKPASR